MERSQSKESFKKNSYSFALGANETPILLENVLGRKLEKTVSDDLLLKELHLNDKPIIIYDISSLITIVEEKESSPFGVFKCYFNDQSKEFLIEINETIPRKVFTRSILLNLLDFGEKEGANIIYACLRKSANDLVQYVQSFLFVGFELSDDEKEVLNFETHIMLKYDLVKEKQKQQMLEGDLDEEIFIQS